MAENSTDFDALENKITNLEDLKAAYIALCNDPSLIKYYDNSNGYLYDNGLVEADGSPLSNVSEALTLLSTLAKDINTWKNTLQNYGAEETTVVVPYKDVVIRYVNGPDDTTSCTPIFPSATESNPTETIEQAITDIGDAINKISWALMHLDAYGVAYDPNSTLYGEGTIGYQIKPYIAQDTEPTSDYDKQKFWIDTRVPTDQNGGLKYWNGNEWAIVPVCYSKN